jgi:apoptosis-inducing factor 2
MSITSPARQTVVVIGGGYGGITVAKALDDVADVVLLEPKEAFVHNVAALRALVDPEWLPRIYLPYDGLLKSGRVVRDRAVKVDAGRVTLASGAELDADYLVLATGSHYPFPAKNDVDGTAAAQHKVRTAHGALAAARRVLLLGAGPVGIELAGEIKAVWPDKRVTLLDVADDVLGERFRADLKAELRRQLADLGVELLLSSTLRDLPPTDPGELRTFTVSTESGSEVTADIWFRCYGVIPVSDYLAGGAAGARRPDGFVDVTRTCRWPTRTGCSRWETSPPPITRWPASPPGRPSSWPRTSGRSSAGRLSSPPTSPRRPRSSCRSGPKVARASGLALTTWSPRSSSRRPRAAS